MGASEDHRHRVLDLECLRRRDVFDRFAGALSGDRFVFIADQNVPAALDEDIGCFSSRTWPQFDMLPYQSVHKVDARLAIPTAFTLDGVRGQQIPLGRTRTERAGCDDLDAGT